MPLWAWGWGTGESPAPLLGPNSHLRATFVQTLRLLGIFRCAASWLVELCPCPLGGCTSESPDPLFCNPCPNRAQRCIFKVPTGKLYQLLFRLVDTGGEGRVGHWPCRWKGGGEGWPLAYPAPPPRPLAFKLGWVGHWPSHRPLQGHWPPCWGGGGGLATGLPLAPQGGGESEP